MGGEPRISSVRSVKAAGCISRDPPVKRGEPWEKKTAYSNSTILPVKSIPSEHWNRRLSRPLLVVHGTTLRTLSDVRAQILRLSPRQQAGFVWRHVTVLLMAAASAEVTDAEQLTIAVEMALRLDGGLERG